MVTQSSSTVLLPPRLISGRNPWLPPRLPSTAKVKIVHGANDDIFSLVGVSVGTVQLSLAHAFNIPPDAVALVNGVQGSRYYRLLANDILEFCRQDGRKGVGERVWTEEEFCQFFKITPDDLQAWIAQGLRVKRCLDDSIRITETAVDDFFREKVIESPYLTIEEAAVYARTTVSNIYGLIERRKIKKMPGTRTVLLTKEILDTYLRGE